MELPPFPISPLDDGKPLNRVPRAVARVEIENQSWILRPCNGLLFARREEQNSNDWTWIATEPPPELLPSKILEAVGQIWKKAFPAPARPELPTSAEELGALWKEAMENNWVARFALYGINYMECVFPYFFCSDGKGFVREFWNRDDFPFDWRTWQVEAGKDVWTYPVSHFQGLTTRYSKTLFETLNNTWNANDEALHFICGSEQELERLSQLICWSEPLFVPLTSDIEVELDSENGFGRARTTSIGTDTHFWYRNDDTTDTTKGWACAGWSTKTPPVRLQRLFELALEHNTPVGLHWEYRDQDSGRASVNPYGISIKFSFSPPSQHEHLEAKLQLRDWLQTRVSGSELKELLGE